MQLRHGIDLLSTSGKRRGWIDIYPDVELVLHTVIFIMVRVNKPDSGKPHRKFFHEGRLIRAAREEDAM